ncbi:MAG: YigZ family protein [Clostridia bacterium]|nr:YigZ family protein [Clostridia bacterium]
MSEKDFKTIIAEDGEENERVYFTCGGARTSFTEKKSVFICSCAHAATEDEATVFVRGVKAEFPDARHNVYAYCVGGGGVPVMRFSDDGEPKGTAGMPVLDAITKSGITDVAVVVTRYFGGILLGASGLTRAYSNSATEGLAAAGKIRMVTARSITVRVPYDKYGKITKVLEKYDLVKEEPVFAEDVSVTAAVPLSQLRQLVTDLNDATAANCAFTAGEKGFYNIEKNL